jgi:hypothetical protein
LVEGKKKKLDANAQEVLDTMQGRYHKYQLRVQAHPADSYSGSEIQVDLADYTERPEQVLVKLKMQDGSITLDELVLQIEIDPETKRMTLRR